ncbi:hypothetical protein D3C81_931350 [compost metagenome]
MQPGFDLAGESRRAGQFADVLQHDRATDARAVTDDLAVGFNDQHLGVEVFFLARHQIVEEAEGDVNRRHAPRVAVFLDGHGAVGARLGAGVVFIRRRPGALTAWCGHAALVPVLVVIVGRRVAVPERVDGEFARGIAVPERTEFVAPGFTLPRQRPDPAAEYFELAVLIDQTWQHRVDGGAVEQRDGLGDAALLRLHFVQLALNLLGDFGDAVEYHLFFGVTQLGGDQLADADHGQHRQQQDEQNQKQRVASLNSAECGHGDRSLSSVSY